VAAAASGRGAARASTLRARRRCSVIMTLRKAFRAIARAGCAAALCGPAAPGEPEAQTASMRSPTAPVRVERAICRTTACAGGPSIGGAGRCSGYPFALTEQANVDRGRRPAVWRAVTTKRPRHVQRARIASSNGQTGTALVGQQRSNRTVEPRTDCPRSRRVRRFCVPKRARGGETRSPH